MEENFCFISYYGTYVVKLLDLLVVTCSISKDCCSATKLKPSGLHCSVCVLRTELAEKEREIAPWLR